MGRRSTFTPPPGPPRPRLHRPFATGVAIGVGALVLAGTQAMTADAFSWRSGAQPVHHTASAAHRPGGRAAMAAYRAWLAAHHLPPGTTGRPTPSASRPVVTPSPAASRPAVTPGPTMTPGPTTAPGSTTVAVGTSSRPFTARSPWNSPLPADPAIDPASSAIASRVLANPSLVVNLDLYAFGIPFYTATASTPRVLLGGRGPQTSVPIDASWTPNTGGDHKMNVIDPSTHTIYELQGYAPATRSVYWYVKHDYVTGLGDGYPTNGEGRGPTGSGLTQAGGIIRIADIKAGSIDHALSFLTSSPVAKLFRYPASSTDGTYGGSDGVQEGMRIQLDPSVHVDSIPGITPGEKMIAKALQKYGAYCVDNGGGNNQAMGFYAEKPIAGQADPYPAVGFTQDWPQLPHIPRDKLRVVAASVTQAPQ